MKLLKAVRNLVAFDTETTGLDPKQESVIQYSEALFENGVPSDSIVAYFAVSHDLDPQVTAIHGLTREILAEKATPRREFMLNLAKQFTRDGVIFAAYNKKFDINFLNNEFEKVDSSCRIDPSRVIDALVLVRHYFKEAGIQGRCTLERAAQVLELEPTGSLHDALEDCRLTGRLILALLNHPIMAKLRDMTMQEYFEWENLTSNEFNKAHENRMNNNTAIIQEAEAILQEDPKKLQEVLDRYKSMNGKKLSSYTTHFLHKIVKEGKQSQFSSLDSLFKRVSCAWQR